MAYTDYLKRNVKTTFKGVFSLDEIYQEVARWAKKNQYDTEEKIYKSNKEKDNPSIFIILEIKKKVSDYEKIGMLLEISGTDIKNTKVKNKPMQEGEICFSIDTFIERDYEDTWSRKNLARFLREVYDKYIAPSRLTADEKVLERDVRALKNTLKDLFRAPILKK